MSRLCCFVLWACALLLGASGCNWILGVDKDYEDGLVLAVGGTGGEAGDSSSGGSGGSGVGGSDGGSGGSGGMGGGGGG